MATIIETKHDLGEKPEPKQKRYKVGKACYTCRVKKIKCDGIQPCMQCKARKRPCTFSKDGVMENNESMTEYDSVDQSKLPPTSKKLTSPPPPPPPQSHSIPAIRQLDAHRNTKTLAAITTLGRLHKLYPGEGREGKWELNQTKLYQNTMRLKSEDSMINNNKSSILPDKATQSRLVNLYYEHCYSLFPIVLKRLFFKQWNAPIQTDSCLQSPLLLMAMFAHAAEKQEEADGYFRQAKTILFEAYLNQPSKSTVIALILMCLYESQENTYPSTYCALALQMCLDLDLHSSKEEDCDLKELAKRICWGCYVLDKFIHLQSGQPWTLNSKMIELDMPLFQPGDDVTEHNILEGFVAIIRLFQTAERVLQPSATPQLNQPVLRTHTQDQMSLNSNNELLYWLRSLPSHLQWAPSSSSTWSSLAQVEPNNTMVAHLHMLYNYVELCVFRPYLSSTVKSIYQRIATVSTNLTQLVSHCLENKGRVFNYAFMNHVLIESLLIHLRNCACDNIALTRHARLCFQQSMHAFKLLLSNAKTDSVTQHITQFVAQLDQAIQEADADSVQLFSEDVMTPFVLQGLHNRYDEDRSTWSRMDYFAHNLITPPTVKSKTIQMSSAMFVHNDLFEPENHDWRAYSTSKNPLDFLSTHWPRPSDKPASSSVQNSPKPPSDTNTTYAPDLLLDQSHSNDIAALVAQIRDKEDNSDDWNTSSSNTTPVIISSAEGTANESNNLIYSLLSDQRNTPTRRPSEQKQYSAFAQPYMNVGLGIYASAHQHHNDVIRQHLPITTNRPALTSQPPP
ncbi:Thiamine repressible genes regulatory protein thi1 [Choanephora cucurbitarum]|uniref:Thiamine repressible genes regulatory protein thi1 n=1 Tax=Choanephora cucurbitarum TaxID=101091 RepID=A0A1C7NLP5_9FUNG|nr:Thiamine repressible genes regulatory protein thi1 [Choanephora cucurbitarum]